MQSLLRLELKPMWRVVKTAPLSFQLTCLYLLFEYVRPQSIYTFIDVLPWAQLSIIGATLAFLFEKGKIELRTPIAGALGLYTLVLLASSFQAFDPSISWSGLELFLSWILVYLIITNTVTTERRFFVFLLLFLLSSFKMSQHAARTWAGRGFSFTGWGVTGAPGWFQNSGEFGIQMCIFLPLSLYFSFAVRRHLSGWKYWAVVLMPVTAVMGMVASSSRGALVGAGLVGAWMVARSRYRFRAAAAALVVAGAVWLIVPSEFKARFDTAGDDRTSEARLTLWEYGIEMANDHPVLGVGYDNFAPYVARAHFGGNHAVEETLLPHNIFIQAWGELGYLGLFALLGLMGSTFWVNHRSRRLAKRLGPRGEFLRLSAFGLDGALVGYIGSGLWVTVLYYPYLWVNLAMTVALHTAVRDTLRREAPHPPRAPARVPAAQAPSRQRVYNSP